MPDVSQEAYDEALQRINDAVQDTMADLADSGMEIGEDDVFHDIACSIMTDLSDDVAQEIARTQLGWSSSEFREWNWKGGAR